MSRINLIIIILISFLAGSLVTQNYVQPRVKIVVTYPRESMTSVIRVGEIDYKFIWFPWGTHSVEELKARYFISSSEARELIREETCQN